MIEYDGTFKTMQDVVNQANEYETSIPDIVSALEDIADAITNKEESIIPDPPTTDGTYTLQCTVTNGVATYAWV